MSIKSRSNSTAAAQSDWDGSGMISFEELDIAVQSPGEVFNAAGGAYLYYIVCNYILPISDSFCFITILIYFGSFGVPRDPKNLDFILHTVNTK